MFFLLRSITRVLGPLSLNTLMAKIGIILCTIQLINEVMMFVDDEAFVFVKEGLLVEVILTMLLQMCVVDKVVEAEAELLLKTSTVM